MKKLMRAEGISTWSIVALAAVIFALATWAVVTGGERTSNTASWFGAWGSWFGGAGSFAAVWAALRIANTQERKAVQRENAERRKQAQIVAFRILSPMLMLHDRIRHHYMYFAENGDSMILEIPPHNLVNELSLVNPQFIEDVIDQLQYLPTSTHSLILLSQALRSYNALLEARTDLHYIEAIRDKTFYVKWSGMLKSVEIALAAYRADLHLLDLDKLTSW